MRGSSGGVAATRRTHRPHPRPDPATVASVNYPLAERARQAGTTCLAGSGTQVALQALLAGAFSSRFQEFRYPWQNGKSAKNTSETSDKARPRMPCTDKPLLPPRQPSGKSAGVLKAGWETTSPTKAVSSLGTPSRRIYTEGLQVFHHLRRDASLLGCRGVSSGSAHVEQQRQASGAGVHFTFQALLSTSESLCG
jgi:hypothetical protein